MKYCSIVHQGRRRLAIVNGDEVLLARQGPLAQSACVFELLQNAGHRARPVDAAAMHVVPVDEVRFQAPMSRLRGNVICLGWNYMEHARESASVSRPGGKGPERPQHPIVFTKATHTVIGPTDDIPASSDVTSELDWEVELGVIIGLDAWKVDESRALQHVFGYTVINDISARDIQFRHKQYFLGKSLPGACPMGPVVVSADEIGDPGNLTLRSYVNGCLKQEATTAQMIFSVAQIISELSMIMPLAAGDVIATGTPAGVGFARQPPEFLKSGDLVECEVDKIGKLRNFVR